MKFSPAAVSTILVVFVAFGLIGQNPPAPSVDRVGFPTNYQNWNLLYALDRPDNKSIRVIYGNDAAASTTFGSQANYPYDSILVMETWRALQDGNGNVILDQNGRFQKDPATPPTLGVMRKGQGFGVDYGSNRNGEWEYVSYNLDGTYQTTPQNSFGCARCHLQATEWRDWVFRNNLYYTHASGGVPTGVIQNYTFVPGVMHVKPGDTVTIYNDDVLGHTITDNFPGGGDSGVLQSGASLSITFPQNASGEFNFHCRIHPAMMGKIVIDPSQQNSTGSSNSAGALQVLMTRTAAATKR